MSVNVTIVKFGENEKTELDDGVKYGDIAKDLGENVQARVGGVDIAQKANDLIDDGATITITPKSLKNG